MRTFLLCASLAGCGTVESDRSDADADSDTDADTDADSDSGSDSVSDTGSESASESDTASETTSDSETAVACTGGLGAQCGDDGECTAFDPSLRCHTTMDGGGLCVPMDAAVCADSGACLAASECVPPAFGAGDGVCLTEEEKLVVCDCDSEGIFAC